MCLLIETARAMTLSDMAGFLGHWASGVSAVMSDDELDRFVRLVSGYGVPPSFAGTLLPYEGVYYG